jgi:hypothetical protein
MLRINSYFSQHSFHRATRASILDVRPRIARIARINRAIPIRAISVIRGSTLWQISVKIENTVCFRAILARFYSLGALGVLCGFDAFSGLMPG